MKLCVLVNRAFTHICDKYMFFIVGEPSHNTEKNTVSTALPAKSDSGAIRCLQLL